MKYFKHSFLLLNVLFAIIIVSSCSTSIHVTNGSFIQKRKYTKGFHFGSIFKGEQSNLKEAKESTQKNSTKKKTLHSEEKYHIIKTETLETSKNCLHKSSGPPKQEKEITIKSKEINIPLDKSVKVKQKKICKDGKRKMISKKEEDDPQNEEEPKINGFGLVSFIGILPPFMGLGALTSLIFGAIALRQFKRNPGNYKCKWMAIAGVIYGYLTSSLVVVFGVLAVVNLGWFWVIGASFGLLALIYIIICTSIIISE